MQLKTKLNLSLLNWKNQFKLVQVVILLLHELARSCLRARYSLSLIFALYSNHKRIGYVKNYKKLVEKNPNTNVFLMPKFLRPRENIRYFVTVLTLSIKSMRLGLKRIFKSNYDARLLINASPYFLSRETYNNYLLKNRLSIKHHF